MNMIVGAAALISAMAVKRTEASPNPDAELIELGRKHDEIEQRYKAATALYAPHWDEHRRPFEEWDKESTARSDADVMAAWASISDEIGLTKLEKDGPNLDAIMGESSPVAEAILAIPAFTIRGLSVKARLAKFGAFTYWDESDDDADWDILVVRKLIDAVIDAAASAA
jgi:hypothetical protein